MYSKKIILLHSTEQGKGCKGICKLFCSGKTVSGTLSLANVDSRNYGLYKCAMFLNAKTYSFELDTLINYEFEINQDYIGVVKVLIARQEKKLVPLCFGSTLNELNYDSNLLLLLLGGKKELSSPILQTQQEKSARPHDLQEDISTQHFFASEVKPKQISTAKQSQPVLVEEALTEYEKFVTATDNYYDGREGAKLLNSYKTSLNNFYENKQSGYYNSVKSILLRIIDAYPRYPMLTSSIDNSIFVKISHADKRFFCLGLLIQDARPKYICYAVPKNLSNQDCLSPNDFTYVFQDAESGKLTKND
ncbi:MAG: hypothetical protein RR248_00485 [Clostridia bacterium]